MSWAHVHSICDTCILPSVVTKHYKNASSFHQLQQKALILQVYTIFDKLVYTINTIIISIIIII